MEIALKSLAVISIVVVVLISMGFYDGLPDGILNRDIMEAVRKFQRANSLVDTGLLDDVTLLYMQRERDKSGIASLSE